MKTYNLFTNAQDTTQEGKADFLLVSESLKVLDETTLISLAVANLTPFSSVEIINLREKLQDDIVDIFRAGMKLGRDYELRGNYLILAQQSLASNETILATLQSLKEQTKLSNFEKLSLTCNSTLIFCAGFLLEASRRFHVVVGGGQEMALCLLIADVLRGDVLMRLKPQNITYASSSWSAKEPKILEIFSQLSYTPHAIYTEINLENAELEVVKNYEKETFRENAGTGATLAYASKNGITNEALLEEMQLIIYML